MSVRSTLVSNFSETRRLKALPFAMAVIALAAVTVSALYLWNERKQESALVSLAPFASSIIGLSLVGEEFHVEFADTTLVKQGDYPTIVSALNLLGKSSAHVTVTFDGIHLTDADCKALGELRNVSRLTITNTQLSERAVQELEDRLGDTDVLLDFQSSVVGE